MEEKNILISFKSDFLTDININVVFKGDKNYMFLKEIFNEYGFGFLSPDTKTIIIDGEIFVHENMSFNDLKYVEAHEVAHIILNHTGDRNDKDEIEADLGAYILLKNKNMCTERLVDEFEGRHGFPFTEGLLDIVKDRL